MAARVLLALAVVAGPSGVFASDGGVTPIEKVLVMLKDLQGKVVIEGKNEARTYDQFACFCKDSTDEKSAAITDGQTNVDTLVGKINSKNSDRNDIDSRMEELNKEIASLDKEMAEETAKHKKNKKAFEDEDAYIKAAIYGVQNAIKDIRAGAGRPEKTGSWDSGKSLISLRKHVKTIRHALMLADALGMGGAEGHRGLAAFLQHAQEQEPVNYEENEDLGAALTILMNLEKDFLSQKFQKEQAESKRVFSYDSFMQQRTDAKNLASKNLNSAQEMHSKKTTQIGELNVALTETQATLHDDQSYLADLVSKCNAKSDEWDQRTKMRQEELAALSTAINIVSTGVQKEGQKLKRFLQVSATVDAPKEDKDSDEATDDPIDAALDEESSVNFLQLSAPRARLSFVVASARHLPEVAGEGLDVTRSEVLDVLRTKGRELKSEMLLKLADKVGADPFAKIKVLIDELIQRLNQEAADEATHKGWCDTSIGKAESTRDDKAEKIAMLNTQLDNHQTQAAKLKDEIAELDAQITELEDIKAKFEKARDDEKAENENTIKEAEGGLDAINDAIDVLTTFYGEAKKGGEISLSQADPSKADDLPDSGFEGDYKGSQSAATGILGMMDVIKSDMKRTITETKAEEADAKREFSALSRKTEVSLETKGDAKTSKESELGDTKAKIATELEDLESNQELLNKSLQELMELQPACIETGMSYEDRVAKREQEIESLNQALCILEKNGPVKEESSSTEC